MAGRRVARGSKRRWRMGRRTRRGIWFGGKPERKVKFRLPCHVVASQMCKNSLFLIHVAGELGFFISKPTSELLKKDQAALAHHKMDLIFSLLRTAIRMSGIVAVVYLLPDVVAPLAGKDTLLGLKVAILGDIKFAISVGLTGSAAAWAMVERSLRHRKVEYLQRQDQTARNTEGPHADKF